MTLDTGKQLMCILFWLGRMSLHAVS